MLVQTYECERCGAREEVKHRLHPDHRVFHSYSDKIDFRPISPTAPEGWKFVFELCDLPYRLRAPRDMLVCPCCASVVVAASKEADGKYGKAVDRLIGVIGARSDCGADENPCEGCGEDFEKPCDCDICER